MSLAVSPCSRFPFQFLEVVFCCVLASLPAFVLFLPHDSQLGFIHSLCSARFLTFLFLILTSELFTIQFTEVTPTSSFEHTKKLLKIFNRVTTTLMKICEFSRTRRPFN